MADDLRAGPSGDGERVIVAKGNAACQVDDDGDEGHALEKLAESSFRLPQSLLGVFALGDVAIAALHADLVSISVEDGPPGCGSPFQPAVFRDEPVFLILTSAALEEAFPLREHAGTVLWMQPAQRLVLLDFGDGVTGQPLDRGVREDKISVHIKREHHLGQVVGHQPEFLLAFPEGLFGSLDAILLTPDAVGGGQRENEQQRENGDRRDQAVLDPVGVQQRVHVFQIAGGQVPPARHNLGQAAFLRDVADSCPYLVRHGAGGEARTNSEPGLHSRNPNQPQGLTGAGAGEQRGDSAVFFHERGVGALGAHVFNRGLVRGPSYELRVWQDLLQELSIDRLVEMGNGCERQILHLPVGAGGADQKAVLMLKVGVAEMDELLALLRDGDQRPQVGLPVSQSAFGTAGQPHPLQLDSAAPGALDNQVDGESGRAAVFILQLKGRIVMPADTIHAYGVPAPGMGAREINHEGRENSDREDRRGCS